MTIDAGDKPLNHHFTIPHLCLAGLVLPDGVVDDIGQIAVIAGNGSGFLLVFHIVQHLANTTMDTPDGCNGHASALHRHRVHDCGQNALNRIPE